MWLDAGWKPRHVKLGGVWVGYDSIEPFNQIMALISDIGDNSQLMGEEWTEKELQKTTLVLMQGIASKSYLAGMQQFVDLFAGRPGQAERILAGLMNNQIPLSSLRNEMGKLFTPYTRELGSGIDQALRNRNLISEYLPGDDLPIKHDLLNGRPIKDHDFLTRAFNAVSPISLNLDMTPGRKLLFDSGYDIRMSTYYSPNGDDLSKDPRIRSMFQKAIGDQNLELKLNRLAENKRVIASIAQMNKDIRDGLRGDYEPSDYFHNQKIDLIFSEARNRAWASIMSDPTVYELVIKQRNQKIKRNRKTKETQGSLQPILQIYK